MNGKPVALTMALPSPSETVKLVESFRYAISIGIFISLTACCLGYVAGASHIIPQEQSTNSLLGHVTQLFDLGQYVYILYYKSLRHLYYPYFARAS